MSNGAYDCGGPLNDALKRLFKPVWAVFRDALPAKAHVRLDHLRSHGSLPDLEHPSTFSEKIAHRKLYDRDPRIPPLVDKITAKEQMSSRFGIDFIIPTLAIFETAAEIDFGALTYPCVVKPNHASGFNVFLQERPANEGELRRRLDGLLRYRHERASEEWAYSQIAARLLVEPWVVESGIDGGKHGLTDYKFHTFGGRVFCIQVDVDRYTNHRRSFFDPSWTPMQFELLYPKASYPIPSPVTLREMLRYAAKIGEGFAYMRVDLYEVGGQVEFGEATFYPGAGLEVFKPPEFDALFGALWN